MLKGHQGSLCVVLVVPVRLQRNCIWNYKEDPPLCVSVVALLAFAQGGKTYLECGLDPHKLSLDPRLNKDEI